MMYFLVMIALLLAGVLIVSASDRKLSRQVGILFSSIALAIALVMLVEYLHGGTVTYSEAIPYISSFGIYIQFYANQFSIPLSLLAGIVTLAALIGGNPMREKEKATTALALLFEASAIGLFASGNLFLFFIFWDVGVIAAFFMISYLGSGNNHASSKTYLFYSILASALLLFGILLIYFYMPVRSFSIQAIEAGSALIPPSIQTAVFALLFVAFMIKMPVFPFHSWMQSAYSDASTQGSMLIGGVLSKFGAYGLLLLFLMLPIAKVYAPYVIIIAIISAFYAAFNMLKKDDMKRMVAYASMVESALILAGISAIGIFGEEGAIYGMVAYGLGIALLFLSVGSIEFMFGSKSTKVLRGVVRDAASTAYAFLFGIFAATGVPLTGAFIADLLIFIGTERSFGLVGLIPLFSIVIVGAYLYYAAEISIFDTKKGMDMVRYESGHWNPAYALLVFAIIAIGLVPYFILGFR